MLTSFFHGNGLSVSADPVSVLVATCSFARAEHTHVLNRRNYCNIPEIESQYRSLAIIFSVHKKQGCPGRDRNDGLSVRAGFAGYAIGTVTRKKQERLAEVQKQRTSASGSLGSGGQARVQLVILRCARVPGPA